MQKPRHVRAVAIAKTQDAARLRRLRLLVISAGAICALMTLPALL